MMVMAAAVAQQLAAAAAVESACQATSVLHIAVSLGRCWRLRVFSFLFEEYHATVCQMLRDVDRIHSLSFNTVPH
jgi:hypothetical protein